MTPSPGPLRVGVASLVEHPMPELAARARRLEELGYDDVWVPDERLLRNVYVSLATVAGATSRVGLGTAVTNPYTRNPALTAAAIATIDELSGGRATLAMGAGGGLGAYGIDRPRPAQALREATEIVRRLTAGETVTYHGDLFRLDGAHLDFPAVRPVPVYLAARGPKILELAGEIADGVIIGGFADERGIGYARQMIGRGLDRAGRDAASVDQMAWLYVSASDDAQAARTAVSKQVLASLVTSRPILPELGLDLPRALLDHLDATGWAYPRETAAEAAALLPDHVVDAFAVHGTPEQCVQRLRAIRACGIDHVCFVLFPADGDTVSGLAERLATDVVAVLTAGT
jgi:5,10-methylenetetrahydromethanopterin reductase